MRRQEIVLSVVYDETETSEPCVWDWAEMLDLPDRDHVSVVHYEPSEPAT